MFLTWKYDRRFVQSLVDCKSKEAKIDLLSIKMLVNERYPGDDMSTTWRRKVFLELFTELLGFAESIKLDIKQISTLMCLMDVLHSTCSDRAFPGVENGYVYLLYMTIFVVIIYFFTSILIN